MKQASIILMVFLTACSTEPTKVTDAPQESESGTKLDSLSGLVIDQHLDLVRAQCTACHSAKLITQNRATREGWEQMIRWMQKDQGLWDLGENEQLILDYLALHYGVKKGGRRTPLTDIDWYVLEP